MMGFRRTSFDIIDRILARDVYSDLGVLLLSAGVRLTSQDIKLLLDRGVHEVEIEETIASNISEQIKELWYKEDHEVSEAYMTSLEKIKYLFQQAVSNENPEVHHLFQTFSSLLELNLKQSYLFLHLNKIKGHDEYTYRHSLNVGILSSVIGKVLGLSQLECIRLGEMGLTHDIGKMKVPVEILNKPGKLTDEEFNEIKKHTTYGYEILKNLGSAYEYLQFGALLHHERLNGCGYPYGLIQNEIPFHVQILSVADTFDAISSDRVYKQKAQSFTAGIELMNEVYGGRLNPKIVIPFVHYLVEGLVGSKAILNSGETAEIMLIYAEEPVRPLIRIGESYVDLRYQRNLSIVNLVSE